MIVGVGFLLFSVIDGVPKLFVIRELKDKPEIFKKKGMLSFPLETFKTADGSYINTIIRSLKEEIGICPDQVADIHVMPDNLHLIPGKNEIVTKYGYGIFLGETDTGFTPTDNDIEFAGWLTCEELLACPLIRVETSPVLLHFLENHRREIFN